MTKDITLYGFDGSTYVRSVRMLLAEKGAPYDQVPVNVLEGEPRKPEHLARHPFGKVPVLDHAGHRLIETPAILRYLNDVLPGPSLIPDTPWNRARADMVISIIDSYGYPALVGAVGYHLFPDFIGGKDDAAHAANLETGRLVLAELMKIRGGDDWLAGDKPSIAEYYLAPLAFYVSLTPDRDRLFDVPGMEGWWTAVQELAAYQETVPDLD